MRGFVADFSAFIVHVGSFSLSLIVLSDALHDSFSTVLFCVFDAVGVVCYLLVLSSLLGILFVLKFLLTVFRVIVFLRNFVCYPLSSSVASLVDIYTFLTQFSHSPGSTRDILTVATPTTVITTACTTTLAESNCPFVSYVTCAPQDNVVSAISPSSSPSPLSEVFTDRHDYFNCISPLVLDDSPMGEQFDPEEDLILLFYDLEDAPHDQYFSFGAYKRVDQKVKPVSGTFPEQARVRRNIPHDPLENLVPLPINPPNFIPSKRITQERMEILNVNAVGFLSSEEEKLFKHVMRLNEDALAFDESERGTLKESYFSPYIIPTVPHEAWVYKNIPIPPGIRDQVIDLLKKKIKAGVYEPSQSAYRSRWFCVLKKAGTLRIVHDLQPLNRVTIRDAGLPPILDDFIEPFAGRQCYTVFDLFSGFDARKMHPDCRDMTAFLTPLGLLRLTAMPMGYTN
jgi:hypothetical protein